VRGTDEAGTFSVSTEICSCCDQCCIYGGGDTGTAGSVAGIVVEVVVVVVMVWLLLLQLLFLQLEMSVLVVVEPKACCCR